MGFSSDGLTALDAAMADFVTQDRRAGVAYGVLQGGELVAQNAFGVRDQMAGLPMRSDTVCRIFSMTRAVSSLALLTLVEAGKVGLDDPVSRFLPQLESMTALDPNDASGTKRLPLHRPITIHHLLTYTAGISYSADWPLGVGIGLRDVLTQTHDLTAAIGVLARCPLTTQPGDKWQYGFASDILGGVMEAVSGLTLDRFIATTVLEPLGMTDTGFWAGAAVDRLAKAYGPVGSEALADVDALYTKEYGDFRTQPQLLSAGGGLCSTIRDYLRFCQFLLDGKTMTGAHIIGPEMRAAMLARQTRSDQGLCNWSPADSESYVRGHGWGLGIGVVATEADSGVPHRGGAAGWYGLMNTFFFIDQAVNVAAVVMSQYAGPDEFALGNRFRESVYAALED